MFQYPSSSKSTVIYSLVDPRDERVRYVGKTMVSLRERLIGHLYESKRGRNKRHNWIRKLTSLGLEPRIVPLETVPPGGDWAEAERRWISLLGASHDLLNGTTGGEGCPGRPVSEKTRRKIGEKNRQTAKNPVNLRRLAQMSRNRPPGFYAAIGAKLKGRKHSASYKANMSEAVKAVIPRGSSHHNAKITEQDVRDILSHLKLYPRDGAYLARKYGLSRSGLSAIRNRKVWGHVELS